MQTTGAGIFAPRAGRPTRPLLAAGVAAMLAACAGFYVARGPAWLGALESAGALHFAALGAGALVLVLVLRRPEWGLPLFAAVLYTNLSEVAVRNYGLPSLLQLLAAAVVGSAALRRLTEDEPRRLRVVADPLLFPLVAYCAVVLLSSLFASNPALSDERLADHLKGLLVFIVVTNLATSRAELRRVVWALVLSGAFLGAVSAAQVLTNSYGHEFGGFGRVKLAQIFGGVREPRVAGPLSDPNFYAQILVALVPLALYRAWDERSTRLRLAAALALAAISGALVFTYSRGGALAAGFVLVLAALHKKVNLRLVLPALALAVLLLLTAPAQFGGRLETLEQFLPDEDEETVAVRPESSIEQRKLLMQSAWEMFEAHPWLGVGAGNYSEHFTEYAAHVGSATPSYENFAERRYPHNLYLEVAAETGILGLMVFAVAAAGALLSAALAARDFRRAGDPRSAALAASVGLALAGYLASSLFLHGHYAQYLWLLFGLAAAARNVAGRHLLLHGALAAAVERVSRAEAAGARAGGFEKPSI